MVKVLIAAEGSAPGVRAARAAVSLLGAEHRYLVVSVGSRPSRGAIGRTEARAAKRSPEHPSMTNRKLPVAEPASPEEEDQAAVAAVQSTLDALRVRAQGRVVAGDVPEAICRTAEDEGADIIVLTSRPGGALRRLWRGSVSNYVLRHAPCAVLVVKPLSDDDQVGEAGDLEHIADATRR